MTTDLIVENLLKWGPAREAETRHGIRILRRARPTKAFWDAWAAEEQLLRKAGVMVSKSLSDPDKWIVSWYARLGEHDQATRDANLVASRAAVSDFNPPCPEGLAYFPFQRAGIAFCLDKEGSYIADEMGLGKTIQAIGLINAVPSIKTVLVITKASLKENWKRELQKWLVRPAAIDIATGQRWARTDIVVTNYDILRKHETSLRKHIWDLVVLDEAANLKNRTTKRTLAVIGSVPSRKQQEAGARVITPIPGRRRLALSGTPLENRTEELWPILNYLNPQRWGNFYTFAARYCDMNNAKGVLDTSGASHLDELQRMLRSTLMIRRMKKDVLKELPPKTRVVVEMDARGLKEHVQKEQDAYNRFKSVLEQSQAEMELARCDDNPAAFKAAVLKLRTTRIEFQEIAKVRHDTAVAKVPALIELLREDIEEAGKILVFGHHRDVLHPLHKAFPGSVLITGETPPDKRQGICDRFQTDPRVTALFGSTRACGEGLTLTAASLVAFVEQDWAPSKLSQAEDRAHRIGQKDNVLVKHYVVPGTIDANMIRKTVEKQEIIDQALDFDPSEVVFMPSYKPLGLRKVILEEGLCMNSLQRSTALTGLRLLADSTITDPVDRELKSRLEKLNSLTHGQAALVRKLCHRYPGLPAALLATMG